MLEIPIVRLDPELALPRRQHDSDAGYDLVASGDHEIAPGERTVVPTGLAFALPLGYAGFVLPRSGMAAKQGITVVNAPGLIDSGYRGEVMVILLNTDRQAAFKIRRGDRIAQLVVQRVEDVTWREVATLDDTDRGTGGHGSTGIGSAK